MTEHLEKLPDGRLLVVGPVHKTQLRQESDGTQRPYTETGIPVARGEDAITVSESVLDAVVASAVKAERKRCGDIIIGALFPHDRKGVENALNAQDLVQATASHEEARGGQPGSENEALRNLLSRAYAMIHDEPATEIARCGFLREISEALNWRIYPSPPTQGDGTATAAQWSPESHLGSISEPPAIMSRETLVRSRRLRNDK